MLNIFKKYFEKIWWYFTPYMEISVRWPKGPVAVQYGDPRWYDCGATWVQIESADPNDHYRPFMEEWIGRQGWDWSWYMGNTDARDNRLTIRIREKHAVFATHIAMMWN
jgi:hypothetical protein